MRSVISVVCVLAVLGAAVFYLNSHSGEAKVNLATAEEQTQGASAHSGKPTVEATRLPVVAAASNSNTERASTPVSSTQVKEVQALSSTDAAWLAAARFPTAFDLENAKGLSDDALRAAGQRRPELMALLGRRLVEQGKLADGLATMKKSVVDGSVYGAEQLAQAYYLRYLDHGVGSQGSLSEAIAWWMVAIRAGDYFAGEQMSQSVREPLKSFELSQATLRSFVLWDEINAQRQQLGLPPLPQTLRPSYNEFSKGQLEGTTLTYDR